MTLGFFLLALIGIATVHCNEQLLPNIIVHKTLITTNPVATQDLVVNVKIFNVGEGTAYDINLVDDSFRKDSFSHVQGLASARWEKLAPGANISHTFVVRPLNPGTFTSKPASLSYRQSPKGIEQTAKSTTVGDIPIESVSQNAKRTAPHLKEWSIFGVLCTIVTVPAFFYWYQLSNQLTVKKTE